MAASLPFIAGFTAAFDGIDFQVHRQLSDGNLVMNERTDVMRRKGRRESSKIRGLVARRRDDRVAHQATVMRSAGGEGLQAARGRYDDNQTSSIRTESSV